MSTCNTALRAPPSTFRNLVELYNATHTVAIRTKAAAICDAWSVRWPRAPFMWALFAATRLVRHRDDVACLHFNSDNTLFCSASDAKPRACFLCGGDHPLLPMADDITEPVPEACACTKWKALVEEFARFCTEQNVEPRCLREILCLERFIARVPCHDHTAHIEALMKSGMCANVTASSMPVHSRERNDLELRLGEARMLLQNGSKLSDDNSALRQYVATLPAVPHTLWVFPENEHTGGATCEGHMWTMAVVLFDMLERTVACDPSVPVFYQRFEVDQQSRVWAKRLRLDWADDGTPVPLATNPWLKTVMEQLFAGKPYRGLMALEPAELRDVIARLTDEHDDDGGWRLLHDELSAAQAQGDVTMHLRRLREEVVERRLPVSELYGDARLSAVIAAVDEVVLVAGLCEPPAADEITTEPATAPTAQDPVPEPPTLTEAIEGLVHSFQVGLPKHTEHSVCRFPAEDEDAAAGLLVCCTCIACSLPNNVRCGVWYPDPLNPQCVDAVDVMTYHLDRHQVPQFECEVQMINDARSSRSLPKPITIHGFFPEGPYHFVATPRHAVGCSLEQMMETGLADIDRFPLAQALLREGRVLWDSGVVHGDVCPVNLYVDTSNKSVRVAFRNFKLSMAPVSGGNLWRLPSSSKRQTDTWGLALVLCEVMTGKQAASTIPAFYEQHGAHTECDAWDLNRKWSNDSVTPVPPATNPWLKAVMEQLFAGKPYRGLMALEPVELRDVIVQLTDEHEGDWRLLRNALSTAKALQVQGDATTLLRRLREEMVGRRLPLSELYGDERLSAVVAVIDEAVLGAGLCFAKNQLSEIVLLSPLPVADELTTAVVPDIDEDAFKKTLSGKVLHRLFQHRSALGVLLSCACNECSRWHDDKRVCPGLWHSYSNAQVEEVSVHLLTVGRMARTTDVELNRAQFSKEVQATKAATRGDAAARIVAHAFDFRDPLRFPRALVAVSTAEGSLSKRLPLLDESECFQIAQALLREAIVLKDLGVSHSIINPDAIMLERVKGQRTVSIVPIPCDTVPTDLWFAPNRHFAEAATQQDNCWSIALVLVELLVESLETELDDDAASPEPVPVFYQLHQAHTNYDAAETRSNWRDAERSSGVRTATRDLIPRGVNPWLSVVLEQLLVGKPYRGLLVLEPAELRHVIAWLTDEDVEDGIWRLLREELAAAGVLEGDATALLRRLREEVVERRLPLSELYGDERLSTAIAAVDEAVLGAGLCFAKDRLGEVQLAIQPDDACL